VLTEEFSFGGKPVNQRLRSVLLVAVATAAVVVLGSITRASQNGDTISIHFGADEPTQGNGSMLDPADVVGVPAVASANWNNVIKKGGVAQNLTRDTNGVAITTDAIVLWEATNTWSSTGKGEENNHFTGANHTLMTGYLDQNTSTPSPIFVQIRNLPDDLASGKYDVYLYMVNGSPGESAGEYTVNNDGPKYVVAAGDTGQFSGPDFVEAVGDDLLYGPTDFGNYVVFRGQTGSVVTITATNLSPFPGQDRAMLNAVQIVKNP
jgi:hypothetical protein